MTESAPIGAARAHRLLRKLTVGYAIFLFCLLVALEWWAEAWLPLGLLIFAPPILFALPLAVLAPLALWTRCWSLCGVHLACLAAVLLFFTTYRLHSPGSNAELTVITHNVGQGNRAAFVDSFPAEKPDAVLLQDVAHADFRETEYRRRYPSYRNRGVAQFILLTPHEIESAEPVIGALWRGKPIAARFVIKVGGRSLAIYNVHLPTPRSSLKHVFSPRVALEMLWLSKAPTDGFSSYRDWLDARVTLARSLVGVFEKEPLPFIVGGDFNMPDHGMVYHTFARKLTDAFASEGHGWGLTFPGARDGRITALLGHWLRLDYWFAGKGWTAVDCRVGNDMHSQHRAVLARFNPAQ